MQMLRVRVLSFAHAPSRLRHWSRANSVLGVSVCEPRGLRELLSGNGETVPASCAGTARSVPDGKMASPSEQSVKNSLLEFGREVLSDVPRSQFVAASQNLSAQCFWMSSEPQLLGAALPQPCPHRHPKGVPKLHWRQSTSDPTIPKHCRVFQFPTFHCSSPDVHPLPWRKVLIVVLCCKSRDSELLSGIKREAAKPGLLSNLMLSGKRCYGGTGLLGSIRESSQVCGLVRQQVCKEVSDWPSTTCYGEYPPRCKYRFFCETTSQAKTSSSVSDSTKRVSRPRISKS